MMSWRSLLLYIFANFLIFVGIEAVFKSAFPRYAVEYPSGVNGSEARLSFCEKGHACNLVHKRFWFYPLVKKFCICKEGLLCSWEWQEKDERTMFINPRAQLKFCKSVTELPTCSRNTVALTTFRYKDERHEIEPKCYCPKYHYLEPGDYSPIGNVTATQGFICKPLHYCNSGEFCGHITTDHYETYYRCSCPSRHLCLNKNKEKHRAQEAFYDGDAYRGICIPW